MKDLKQLGVTVLAAVCLTAVFGVSAASATTLTSPAGTKYTGSVNATAEGTLTLHAGFTNITCTESEVVVMPNAQSDTTTVTGPITTLTFPAASCNKTVTVINKGSVEIHVITGGPNGTLTGKNSRVTVAELGISCVYGTAAAGTDLGTVTGSDQTNGTATIDINAELPLFEGSEFFCAHPAHWEGSYKVTSPDYFGIS